MSAPHAPPQKTTNNRSIPPEILEKILSNLPVKSLLRFSSASKPLNSLIFEQDFIKKHRRRTIVLNGHYFPADLSHLSSCPVSAVLPGVSTVDTGALVSPFEPPIMWMKAFCDELWCVEFRSSLYLWNPSMRTCMKLPAPSRQFDAINCGGYDRVRLFYDHVYGLGYDSVGDDYKILRLGLEILKPVVAELYSLRINSWREVKTFPGDGTLRLSYWRNMGLFVAGALHWVVHREDFNLRPLRDGAIVSFNLSTHEYGEVGFPRFDEETDIVNGYVEMIAIRGKLCLSVNYQASSRLVLWEMQDYGVTESWTKKLDIDCKAFSCFEPCFEESFYVLRPLYSYDNGDILIAMTCKGGEQWSREQDYLKIFVYNIDEGKQWRKYFRIHGGNRIFNALVYAESFVSPAVFGK